MLCTNCQNPVQPNATACPYCNAPIQSHSNPYATPSEAPQAQPYQQAPANQGDGTGGVIPYKNPKALIAYYLGILSGLPLIGLPLGVIALVLGIQGLRDRKRNPIIKGSLHAWVGIGCGGVFAILWTLFVVSLIFAMMANR